MSSLNCPHCGNALDPVATNPLSDWGGARLFVCFNEECCYFSDSWSVLEKQGSYFGYRYYYSEDTGNDGALLVSSKESYVDCIISEEEYLKPTPDPKEIERETEYQSLCEAIKHAEQVAKEVKGSNVDCAIEHRQLAKWLRQLKTIKFPHRAGTKKP
jgi:hypothetical protein